jgi:hypothetical protein
MGDYESLESGIYWHLLGIVLGKEPTENAISGPKGFSQAPRQVNQTICLVQHSVSAVSCLLQRSGKVTSS